MPQTRFFKLTFSQYLNFMKTETFRSIFHADYNMFTDRPTKNIPKFSHPKSPLKPVTPRKSFLPHFSSKQTASGIAQKSSRRTPTQNRFKEFPKNLNTIKKIPSGIENIKETSRKKSPVKVTHRKRKLFSEGSRGMNMIVL